MKRLMGTTVIYIGYVFLLLGFVCLGLFVAALASGSSLAVAAGLGIVGFFAASVLGFRNGSRRGVATLWSEAVSADQVDHYLASYRSGEKATSVADEPADEGLGTAHAA